MRSGRALSGARAVALLAAACLLPASVTAQGPAGAPTGAPPAQSMAATDLEPLVARIALYPDDLLAIMLPAATTPLDLVKGQRFLDKRTSDPNLKPDANLAEPVRNLLNYPEIVKSMTDDLDWTVALGEAVTNQQQGLIAAIQAFRRKAQAAGNLKTDDKQSVVQQAEVIQILPANPEVIYVPQYQPSVVIVQQPAPVVTYAPTPYPVYYYPYPPGAALATGLIVGAATAYAFSWTNHAIHHGYDVHELQEERLDYARESREDWQSHQKGMQDDRQQATADRQGQRQDAVSDGQGQRPQPQPTQTSAQQPRTQQTQTQRQGSAAPTQQAQQPRTSAAPTSSQAQQPRAQGAQAGGQTWQPQQTGGGQVNRGQAQSTQYSRPGESSFGGGGAGSGGAFGGVGSGSQSSFQSQRGSYSRSGGGYSGGGGGRRR
jgi:hypothetical protein